jgi:hypothetical protein
MDIIEWFVDETTSYDANGNGMVFADEFRIENQYNSQGLVTSLRILGDPIFPCWETRLSFEVRNHADAPIEIGELNVSLDGEALPTYFIFSHGISGDNVLDPGESVQMWIYIHFIGQDYPNLQGHTFNIQVTIPANTQGPPAYQFTINAHCYTEDKDVNVSVTVDDSQPPYGTPYTFTRSNDGVREKSTLLL